MVQALKRQWITVVCTAFVLLNLLLTANDMPWLALLPAALIAVWAMLAAADKLLLFIVFATPLSINLEQLDLGGIGISLPTEPLMVGLTVLFLLKVALEKGVIAPGVLRHPITGIIVAQLVWMTACIVPSAMPLVSFKFLLARLWFVTTCYFMATRLFEDGRNMKRMMWLFITAMAGVIVYTLINHAQHHFEQDPAHWVMTPFFKDHTSYGAIIAFFLPFLVAAPFMRDTPRTLRGYAVVMLLLFAAGLVFSYTRAAWVSLVGAFGMLMVLRLRIPPWVLLLVLGSGGALYAVNADRITVALERNREESSDDLGEHVQSISNISSDASNLERLNRWNSALRMWQERPVFGWGPGTYMFQYAPFQASEDRTIISTNFGTGGNAHSEYLGPLAEQGVPGMLLMVLLVVVTVWTVMRLYPRMAKGPDRTLLVVAFLGLVTYYLHGALNNFLDTDKAAVPFWMFTAMVVLFDLRHPKLPRDREALSAARS